MNDFWHTLPQPFFVLAPMEDVTDAAFRRLIANKGLSAVEAGDPDIPRVMFTEFTSADGLMRADEVGKRKLMRKLLFSEIERPIVAQLFSSVPEYMEEGARLCAELGFDGFDINMGCPDKAIERQGCGAALIRTPELARELIRAAKRGAGSMPVSVKTRIGYNKDELDQWLPELLAEEPALITLHARTRKEMSDVPARWDRVRRGVEIRDEMKSETLIVGNGDVKDLEDAKGKAAEHHAEGVMLGRAIFGNPWLFTSANNPGQGREISPEERIKALIEHITLFEELLSDVTSPAVMKRHFKAYINGWDHAKDLRAELMDAPTLADARVILEAAL